ncbi:MAG: zf-HC2 domain-containing protein [bacterium]
MTGCESYELMVSKCLDDELDDIREIEMHAHMASCSECREYFRSTLSVRRTIAHNRVQNILSGMIDTALPPSYSIMHPNYSRVRFTAIAMIITMLLIGSTMISSISPAQIPPEQQQSFLR